MVLLHLKFVEAQYKDSEDLFQASFIHTKLQDHTYLPSTIYDATKLILGIFLSVLPPPLLLIPILRYNLPVASHVLKHISES